MIQGLESTVMEQGRSDTISATTYHSVGKDRNTGRGDYERRKRHKFITKIALIYGIKNARLKKDEKTGSLKLKLNQLPSAASRNNLNLSKVNEKPLK